MISNAFGAENRTRLISHYFAEQGNPAETDAWQHVYRLLLWIDRTTGLAHCYESDKSQPGRRWYGRSLAFHDWVASGLDVLPSALASEIDYLFRRATEDLATAALRGHDAIVRAALRQREPYEGRGFPEPGEDPELLAILRETLAPYLAMQPPTDVWQMLVQRVQQHMTQENKRKNLVGEGFEDVLASIVRLSRVNDDTEVFVRRRLGDLPGFHTVRRGEKPKVVDLAVVHGNKQRTLITAKWSVRADREEQFKTDYDDYIKAESFNQQFSYLLITNEFDPARLKRACERLERNAPMLTHVVHINTDALLATYGTNPERSAADVVKHIEQGRLISLAEWLSLIAS